MRPAASGSASARPAAADARAARAATAKLPVQERLDQIEAGTRLECHARIDATRDRQHREQHAEHQDEQQRPQEIRDRERHAGEAVDDQFRPASAEIDGGKRKHARRAPPRSVRQTDTSSSVAGSLPSTSVMTFSRRLMELPKSPCSDLPDPDRRTARGSARRARTDAAAGAMSSRCARPAGSSWRSDRPAPRAAARTPRPPRRSSVGSAQSRRFRR